MLSSPLPVIWSQSQLSLFIAKECRTTHSKQPVNTCFNCYQLHFSSLVNSWWMLWSRLTAVELWLTAQAGCGHGQCRTAQGICLLGEPLEVWWLICLFFLLKIVFSFLIRFGFFFPQLTQTWGICHFSWEKIKLHKSLWLCLYFDQNTKYSYKKRKSPFDNVGAKENNLHQTS